ncbi:uncharacterized protein LOC117107074 [Anneissia japonica]|uniref:uncharacterized protein LOC117107074 n=1 Tax=Anneissia japonica TaxID=1529436 RepID=UPI001425998D|nr:uncharacterized protein LOC117107074 [Anneissia japonica]
MENKDVEVVLTNSASLRNETIRRGNAKQHRDDVTLTLLSNGKMSCNYPKDEKLPFTIDLSNCDSISISPSRSNNALCIEIGVNVNHLIFQNKSLMAKWYDTIVNLLNRLGFDFNTETDPKNPKIRIASQRKIRPKTSVKRRKAISAVPVLLDGYADGQSVEATYNYIPPKVNMTEMNNDMAYTETQGNNNVQSSGSYLNERHCNVLGYESCISRETIGPPALPHRPQVRHSKVEPVSSVDRMGIDDPVEPIASVDRLPVASVDKTSTVTSTGAGPVDVTSENVNCNNIKEEYLEPHIQKKNIEHVFSSNPKEYNGSPNTFRKRTNNLKSRMPDCSINTKVNKFGERGDSSRSHTKHLVQEMSQESLMISVSKNKLEGNVVLSMMPNTRVLFIAGLKNSSLNHTLYEGDMITMINKQSIDSIQDALRTIRNTATDTVDLVIVRIPYGKVVTIELQENESDLGFKLEGRKVDRVDEEGLAAMAGLKKKTIKPAELGRFTGTCVTAINCLPLGHHCTKDQTMELLSMHRDYVSLVMQPLDLVACFQHEMDALETQN